MMPRSARFNGGKRVVGVLMTRTGAVPNVGASVRNLVVNGRWRTCLLVGA